MEVGAAALAAGAPAETDIGRIERCWPGALVDGQELLDLWIMGHSPACAKPIPEREHPRCPPLHHPPSRGYRAALVTKKKHTKKPPCNPQKYQVDRTRCDGSRSCCACGWCPCGGSGAEMNTGGAAAQQPPCSGWSLEQPCGCAVAMYTCCKRVACRSFEVCVGRAAYFDCRPPRQHNN
jgi:hypothetical protein